jgi:hypothetical protein
MGGIPSMGCGHLSFKPNSGCEHRASDSALAAAPPLARGTGKPGRSQAFPWRGILENV